MEKYRILISDKYLDAFKSIFRITYSDESEIDFNSEGIGFVASIKIKDIPIFLKEVISENYMSYEYSGFCFGPITEGEKVLLEKDLIEVYVLENKTILSNKDFFILSLQIANRSMEAVDILNLMAKGLVDEEWIQKVKDSIPLLKAKLKNIA